MNNLDIQLKDLYRKILSKSRMKTDKVNIGTKSIFGHQMKFDMSEGFPLTTLRNIDTNSLIHETLWFLSSYDDKYKQFGLNNIKYLVDNKQDAWSDIVYRKYYDDKFKTYQENDLKDPKTVKKFKFLSQVDFLKKIKKDDNFAIKHGNLDSTHFKQWLDWNGRNELVEKTNNYKETKAETVLVDKLGWENVYIKGTNQFKRILELLVNEPDSRKIVMSAWNIEELEEMESSNSHTMLQFYTEVLEMVERIDYCEDKVSTEDIKDYMSKNDVDDWDDIRRNPVKQVKILGHFNIPERKISLQFYMRSSDAYILPYNIATYALILNIVAQTVDMVPYELIYTSGDTHIYSNTIKFIEEILEKEIDDLPKIELNETVEDIYDFRIDDIKIK